MFSRYSLYLDKHDAVTPQELVTTIETSYTPTHKVYEIKETYNSKDLFQPYLEDIHGHTEPHHFRFRLVGEEVELKHKNWSTEKEWLPVSENINVFRAGCPTVCILMPTNAEELRLEKLMNDIEHQSTFLQPSVLNGKRLSTDCHIKKRVVMLSDQICFLSIYIYIFIYLQERKIIKNEKRCRNGVPESTQTRNNKSDDKYTKSHPSQHLFTKG